MTVERIQYPDDLYATREDGVAAAPMPMPQRKPAPIKKTSAAVKTMSIMPPTAVALPEADLPLFDATEPAEASAISPAFGLPASCLP